MRTSYSFPKHHPQRPSLPTPTYFCQMLSSLGATDFVPVAGGKEKETSSTSGSPRLHKSLLGGWWASKEKWWETNRAKHLIEAFNCFLVVQCNQYLDQHFSGEEHVIWCFAQMAKFDDATVLWPFHACMQLWTPFASTLKKLQCVPVFTIYLMEKSSQNESASQNKNHARMLKSMCIGRVHCTWNHWQPPF